MVYQEHVAVTWDAIAGYMIIGAESVEKLNHEVRGLEANCGAELVGWYPSVPDGTFVKAHRYVNTLDKGTKTDVSLDDILSYNPPQDI
jgi:hypothetical protein